MKLNLIFISGWAMPEQSLTGLMRALRELFTVHLINVSGLDDGKPGTNGLSGHAASLVQRLESMKKPYILAGWSMGGMVCMEAVSHLAHSPTGLILLGTTPSFCVRDDFPWGFPQVNVRALAARLIKDASGALTRFYELACHPHDVPQRNIARWVRRSLEFGIHKLDGGLQYLSRYDLRPVAAKIRTPSLVIHGRLDKVVPWQAGEWLSRHMTRAQFAVHENSGHDLPVRYPAWAAAQIGRWGSGL